MAKRRIVLEIEVDEGENSAGYEDIVVTRIVKDGKVVWDGDRVVDQDELSYDEGAGSEFFYLDSVNAPDIGVRLGIIIERP